MNFPEKMKLLELSGTFSDCPLVVIQV